MVGCVCLKLWVDLAQIFVYVRSKHYLLCANITSCMYPKGFCAVAQIFFAKSIIVFSTKALWERQIRFPHFHSSHECLLRFRIFAKSKIANILSYQLHKSFFQNAQQKSKNLFVRPHTKKCAFRNKKMMMLRKKLSWEKHFLHVAQHKKEHLLKA